MKEFLKRSGILIVTLLGVNIGVMLVLPFGLVVAEFVIWPLALVIGALFAAIAAGWAGNLLAPGRSRFLPIAGVSEVTAAVVAVLLAAIFVLILPLFPQNGFIFGSPSFLLGLGVIFIAMGASWAAWHFRSTERDPARDAAITLGLMVLAILLFVATLLLAGLFGVVEGA